jgi:hypothetical protein
MKNLVLASLIVVLAVVIAVGEGSSLDGEAVLAAYDFEQIEGGIVMDVSGNGNNGTLGGDPQQVDGVIGKALEFDGDDHVDLGDNQFLLDEVTIMFWVNGISSGPGCCPTFFVTRLENWNACGIFWAGPTLRPFCLTATFGEEAPQLEGPPIEDDDWHHVAAVFSGVSGRAFYVDGVVMSNADYVAGFDDLEVEGTTNTYIAWGRTQGNIEYAIGSMDEILIAQGVVSDEDVQQHMNFGIAGATSVQPSEKLTTTWAIIKENL